MASRPFIAAMRACMICAASARQPSARAHLLLLCRQRWAGLHVRRRAGGCHGAGAAPLYARLRVLRGSGCGDQPRAHVQIRTQIQKQIHAQCRAPARRRPQQRGECGHLNYSSIHMDDCAAGKPSRRDCRCRGAAARWVRAAGHRGARRDRSGQSGTHSTCQTPRRRTLTRSGTPGSAIANLRELWRRITSRRR